MKKLIGVFALCLSSSLTFADEASVKMVLDSVHEKKLFGCDDAIQKEYESDYYSVSRVEVRIPLAINEQGDYSKSVDEAIVVVNGNPALGSEDIKHVVETSLFRIIGKRCVSARVSREMYSSSRNCNQTANVIGKTGSRAKTENTFWVGYDDKYSEVEDLLTSLPNGGCWITELPDDRFRSYIRRN